MREIIVVEGKNDTNAVKQAVDADTIETNGSEISERTIEEIRRAHQSRGVIVFTDPDTPGERIRRIITRAVPEVKHAFLPKHQARGNRKIGIEHASSEAILEALEQVRTDFSSTTDPLEILSWDEYLEVGFSGQEDSRELRERVAEELRIGYANGKQFYKRLHALQVTRDELKAAIEKVKGQMS
ncbi:ribonuclease M5 [Risungbinella massiliensis]|uniref:ribonuclease M5 n=1 Tax=Risungbinella massiliensis TaxID=1329796 RepID=UPI0005CBCF8D|nr:ribonuclease M5 [Risungbinella massiliensis]